MPGCRIREAGSSCRFSLFSVRRSNQSTLIRFRYNAIKRRYNSILKKHEQLTRTFNSRFDVCIHLLRVHGAGFSQIFAAPWIHSFIHPSITLSIACPWCRIFSDFCRTMDALFYTPSQGRMVRCTGAIRGFNTRLQYAASMRCFNALLQCAAFVAGDDFVLLARSPAASCL
jgi:hypothetical protein